VTEPGWLTFDQFSGRVGEAFDISVDGGPTIRTELVEAVESAEAGGTGPDGQQRLQFSLVFRGPLQPALPQAIHGLDHADIGHLDLFLVPIGPDGVGMRYQAVFT
jgi:hypothetical protein